MRDFFLILASVRFGGQFDGRLLKPRFKPATHSVSLIQGLIFGGGALVETLQTALQHSPYPSSLPLQEGAIKERGRWMEAASPSPSLLPLGFRNGILFVLSAPPVFRSNHLGNNNHSSHLLSLSVRIQPKSFFLQVRSRRGLPQAGGLFRRIGLQHFRLLAASESKDY